MKRITLITPFASYPVGEYILKGVLYSNAECGVDTDGYRYTVGQYRIHPDIVEGMKDHFEPIEEPKKDWIDEAYDYYQTPIPARDKSNDVRFPMKFREAIEKHIPPRQELYTESMVEIFAKEWLPVDSIIISASIKGFLKSKGVLSEDV